MLLVQKFGGSSVADVTKIRMGAERIAAKVRNGHQVVVTVSAMGRETDDLLQMAPPALASLQAAVHVDSAVAGLQDTFATGAGGSRR